MRQEKHSITCTRKPRSWKKESSQQMIRWSPRKRSCRRLTISLMSRTIRFRITVTSLAPRKMSWRRLKISSIRRITNCRRRKVSLRARTIRLRVTATSLAPKKVSYQAPTISFEMLREIFRPRRHRQNRQHGPKTKLSLVHGDVNLLIWTQDKMEGDTVKLLHLNTAVASTECGMIIMRWAQDYWKDGGLMAHLLEPLSWVAKAYIKTICRSLILIPALAILRCLPVRKDEPNQTYTKINAQLTKT